jgi:hypothetical protein
MAERIKDFLDKYIEYREKFEDEIRESYPAIAVIRGIGTSLLRGVRDAVGLAVKKEEEES